MCMQPPPIPRLKARAKLQGFGGVGDGFGEAV